jgi:hypothetical protein
VNSAKYYLGSIPLAVILTAPAALIVGCGSQQSSPQVSQTPDNHRWDDHENQAWHRFLTENHRPDHEFAKSDNHEQKEYWNWRHSHPD